MNTSLVDDDASLELSPDDVPLTEAGILIIDEDPAFQLGLKTFLKEYVGFEKVFTAENGKEAIDLIEQEDSIELLTVDYQMPEMDGLELLAHLKEHAPRPLAATMITGFPSDELKKEFESHTSSRLLTGHFLCKPVEFEKLEPVILEAYEELKQSRRLTETMTGVGEERLPVEEEEEELALPPDESEIAVRLDALENKIDAHARAVSEMSKNRTGNAFVSFWSDVLKMVIVALLILVAWEWGLIDRARGFLRTNAPASLQPLPGGSNPSSGQTGKRDGSDPARPRNTGVPL